MSIEEDCMEECDGCGNFMFECKCEEGIMKEIVVVTTNVGGEDLYYSGVIDGVPQYVFDKRGASWLAQDIAEHIAALCNASSPYFFRLEKL